MIYGIVFKGTFSTSRRAVAEGFYPITTEAALPEQVGGKKLMFGDDHVTARGKPANQMAKCFASPATGHGKSL